MIFALLPAQYLTPQDYANISRLVTRASLEKQLLLAGEEVVGLYRLLITFLHKAQATHDPSVAAATSAAASCSGADATVDHVLHEVMRAVAQLLLIRNDKILRYRYDALSVLLRFCDPKSNFNIECRHTAIDGLGNLLNFPATERCLLPHHGILETSSFLLETETGHVDRLLLTEPQLQELETFISVCKQRGEDIGTVNRLSPEARAGVYLRMRSEKLAEVQDLAVYILLENLKLSSMQLLQFLTTSKLESTTSADHRKQALQIGIFNKLLVSCLRALAHALIAAQPYSPFAVSQQVRLTEKLNASGSYAFSNGTSPASKKFGNSSPKSQSTIDLNTANVAGGTGIGTDAGISYAVHYATPLFTQHFRSLTQSAHFLFSRLLPTIMGTAAMMTGRKAGSTSLAAGANASDILGGANSINGTAEHKLWSHVLKMFAALARYDPLALMASWPLFFTDTHAMDALLLSSVSTMINNLLEKEEETKSEREQDITAVTAQSATSAFLALLPVTLMSPVSFFIPSFNSPIFSSAVWARQPSIRSAAVQCIHAMINGLQMSKWLRNLKSKAPGGRGTGNGKGSKASPQTAAAFATSDKMPLTIVKIFRVLVLLLTIEREESVVKDILDCASSIVLQMPLLECQDTTTPAALANWTSNIHTHIPVSESPKDSAKSTKTPPAHVHTNNSWYAQMEDFALLIFREAMVIASENPYILYTVRDNSHVSSQMQKDVPVDSATGVDDTPNVLRGQSASLHALNWLADMCRRCPSVRCFGKALTLRTYSTGSYSPLDVRSGESTHASLNVNPVNATAASNVSMTTIKLKTNMTFIQVVGDMCNLIADERMRPYATTAYHNAARQLQHLLLQTYPALYLRNPSWLRSLIDNCRECAVSSMRLLGIKMTCTLLMLQQYKQEFGYGNKPIPSRGGADNDDEDDEIPFAENSTDASVTMSTLVGVHTLLEVTTLLLLGARDSDHLIRGQAVGSFGQFTSQCWTAMRKHHGFLSVRKTVTTTIDGKAVETPVAGSTTGFVDTSVRAAVIQCLILACGDNVGTVRTAAQKSLGEAIVVGGLTISDPILSEHVPPRSLFIIAETNAVQARAIQAEQVQAESLAQAMSQAAVAAAEEGYTAQQRLDKMPYHPQNVQNQQIQTHTQHDWHLDTNTNSGSDVLSARYGESTHGSQNGRDLSRSPQKANTAKPRRSHQIDHTITYSIPAPNSMRWDTPKGDLCIDTISPGTYVDIIMAVLLCLRDGCADSKLGVRLQATWALGNLLLVILPNRQAVTFPPKIAISSLSGASAVGASVPEWSTDEVWLSLCNICVGLLTDSDKLLASTVRCLGLIAAGLSPWDGTHFGYLSAVVTVLIQKVLLAGLAGAAIGKDFNQLVETSIETHPHKLVFSVCQSLGFVGWVLVNRGDNDAGGVTPAVSSCINKIRSIQAEMLRYGKLKVQIQACRALVSEIHKYSSRDNTPAAYTPGESPKSMEFMECNGSDIEGSVKANTSVIGTNNISVQDKSTLSGTSSGSSASSSTSNNPIKSMTNEMSQIMSGLGFKMVVPSIKPTNNADADGALSARGNEETDDNEYFGLGLGLVGSSSGEEPNTDFMDSTANHSKVTPMDWETRTHSLIMSIEACLVVVSNSLLLDADNSASASIFYSRSKASAASANHTKESAKIANANKTTKNISENTDQQSTIGWVRTRVSHINVPEINKSSMERNRLTTLQRGLLVLLWVILRQGQDMFNTALFMEALSYHAESVSEWLCLMVDDDRPLQPSELSMTQEPLASTSPAGALQDASSPRAIVPLVARRYLYILGSSTYSGTSSGNIDLLRASSIARSTSALTETARVKLYELAKMESTKVSDFIVNNSDPVSVDGSHISVTSAQSLLGSPLSKSLQNSAGVRDSAATASDDDNDDPDEI